MFQGRFEDHEHTYFPLQNSAIKSVFEPFIMDDGSVAYKMVDYMYMFCKCGTDPVAVPVIKQKQKTKEGQNDNDSD